MSKSILLILLFAQWLMANNLGLTTRQVNTIQEIINVSKHIKNKKGESFPKTLAAISLVESSAGINVIGDIPNKDSAKINLKKSSLGVIQIRLNTAKWMIKTTNELKKYSKYSDVQLINKLISNNAFSAEIGSYFIVWLSNNRKNYMETVSGYNGGIVNWKYYSKVGKALKIITKLNNSGAIHL